MVNPGPLKICSIFLAVDKIKEQVYPINLTRRLIIALEDFIRFCFLALNISTYEKENDTENLNYKKLQDMLFDSFNKQLSPVIKSAVDEAKKALDDA